MELIISVIAKPYLIAGTPASSIAFKLL